MKEFEVFIGLDVGSVRIGIARIDTLLRHPTVVATRQNSDDFVSFLDQVCKEYSPSAIIVGLPRNMKGQETKQSLEIRRFADVIRAKIQNIPIMFQDETLTTVAAEERLRSGVMGDKDSLAACEILKDYIQEKYQKEYNGTI